MGSPSIPGGVQGSPVVLSTQSPWGTNVSPAAPYQQCATSCHLGDAGYQHTTSYSNQRTNINSPPPTASRDASIPTRIKWWHCSSNLEATMPRPEEEEAAGLYITPEEWPCQKWKEGRPLVRLLKKSHQEALRKDSALVQFTRWIYFKMHCPNYDQEESQASPTPSRRWPPLLASWALMSMRFSRYGLAERTSGLLTMWRKLPQRVSISSGWCFPPNHPRSWA